MLPYMTEIRHSIRENAMMGFELTEQLVAFGRQFHGQLQAALPKDIYAPEGIQLMNAWRELESKFIAFMDLVPFSDPLQLQAMLAQTEEFEKELKALPGLRTRVYPKKRQRPLTKHQLTKRQRQPSRVKNLHSLCLIK